MDSRGPAVVQWRAFSRPPSMRSRPRTARRLAAWAALLSLQLSLLAGFGHFALERHDVCTEHGELEHGSLEPTAPVHGAPRVGAGGDHAADHDLCRVPALVGVPDLDLAAPAQVAPLAQGTAPLLGRAVPRPLDRLFLLAPKQSPPARAALLGA